MSVFWCCHHGTATVRVHPVHVMNAARAICCCRHLEQFRSM